MGSCSSSATQSLMWWEYEAFPGVWSNWWHWPKKKNVWDIMFWFIWCNLDCAGTRVQIWEEIPPEHHLLSHLALMLSGKPEAYKLLSILSWAIACCISFHFDSLQILPSVDWSFSFSSNYCSSNCCILPFLHCVCVCSCAGVCALAGHTPDFRLLVSTHHFFVITHLPLVTLLKLLFKDVS